MGRKKLNNDSRILEELVNVIGPSGFEKPIQKYYQDLMSPIVDNVYTDKIGNCYAEIEGDKNAPKIMVNAHADTVGFMVKFIDDLGFIFTEDLSGFSSFDYRMLPGTPVKIIGRKSKKIVKGDFIPIVPIHKLDEEDLRESIDREELAIDIGVKSLEQAKHYVDIADYVVLESTSKYREINGNNHFIGTNLDDRSGMYCMYLAAKELKKSRIKRKCPITFVSTILEEGDPNAAQVAAMNVKPDIGLTIDSTVATDSIRNDNEDTLAKKYGLINLDGGVAISRGRGIDDDLFLYMERLCSGKISKRVKIPYQIEVGCGLTENVNVQIADKGIKTGLLSIPTRNLHTSIETISMKDLESTTTLLTELYKKISQGKFPI